MPVGRLCRAQRSAELSADFTLGCVTLFPEAVEDFARIGLLGRALETGRLALHTQNPRAFAAKSDGRVDDTPFGGGPGMLLQAEPMMRAIEALREKVPALRQTPVYLLAASGSSFTQTRARQMAELSGLILLCGRYEGVDARLLEEIDGALRIGDFVLQGGEVAALAMLEAITRLRPGVLGNLASTDEESFDASERLEYPQYTKPRVWRGRAVPEVLLSGDHAAITRWREAARATVHAEELAP